MRKVAYIVKKKKKSFIKHQSCEKLQALYK